MGRRKQKERGTRNVAHTTAARDAVKSSVRNSLRGSTRGRSSNGTISPAQVGESLSESHSTRNRLIEAARQLFLVNGYEGTGISEILRKTGINSGSLYYFFKKKEDLLLAVLDRYIDLLHPMVIDPVFEREDDPIERVFGVLQGYRELLTMTDCRMGCPIGNLALEMSEKSEAVREKIATNFDNWRIAIRKCLIDAVDILPAETDPDQLSTFILTVMEGAVMQARAHRSPKPFDDSIEMLRDYFERMINTKKIK